MKRKLLISEKELKGKFAESIYSPVAETDIHNINKAIEGSEKNLKHLQEIDAFFKEEGTSIFRYFDMTVADGKAFYQIINFDKNTNQFLVKRCKGICLDEYADGYLGDECWADGEFVARLLQTKDTLSELFSKNKK